jgi:NADH-quinone oxidoreductase subunit J
MEAVLFFIAAIGALAGAVGVVASRNPFYSVLALIAHLFSLAVLFLLLTSAFVAAAQVVVYAGAVMVLYVFVVAYVGGGGESAWDSIPGQRLLGMLLGSIVFIELSAAILSSALKALNTHGPDVPSGFGNPAAIGRLLLEKFLLPFEATSILLLLAAVGAVVLAARKRDQLPSGGDGSGDPATSLPSEDGGLATRERGAGAPSERFAREERPPSGDSSFTPIRRGASEEGAPVARSVSRPATSSGGI